MRIVALLGLLALLAACSSDSGNDGPATTSELVVNAGADISADEGSTVSLNGAASGGSGTYTFTWSITPTLTITQEDTSVAAATLVAPATTENLTFTITLTVTDDGGTSQSDTRTLTVVPVNVAPVAQITLPAVPGSIDGRVPAGGSISLSASASTDPDAATAPGIVSFAWAQTAGANVLSGISLGGDTLVFTAPIASEGSTLGFELTVTDAEGAQGTDTIDILVLADNETLPIADAGVNQSVFSGEVVFLSGQGSSTVPAAAPLTFRWLTDSQFQPSVDDANTASTFAVAPEVTGSTNASFTLEVTDQFGNVVEDDIAVQVRPLPISLLNDTGVTQRTNAGVLVTQPANDFPGQDGDRGRDIIDSAGLLAKAGRGQQGFDFTRLDALGDQLDDSATDWRCVRDNVTGLVWEVKQTAAGLHAAANTYSWLQTENTGGFGGVAGGGTCTLASCDTQSFVAAANAAGLCGFFDWRLPNYQELVSVLHLGKTSAPFIDAGYFPNTTTGVTSGPVWYWTSVPSADGSSGAAQNAWAIDYAGGNDNFLNKATAARVRLVRAGR